MQAILLDGTPQYVINHPEPTLSHAEARIRPLVAGVCSTDIELCKGYMGFKGVLGHEFVGIVEETRDPADRAWIGKRVVGTINCACGKCDMCRRHIPEHCRHRTVLGIFGRDGCFAGAFGLPVANLLEVPESISNEQAVFAEPLAAAFEIERQLAIRPDETITVLGDGRLGLLCAQVLARGHSRTRLLGKHPEKLALAGRWGIPAKLTHQVEFAQDQDIVVECTGSADGVVAAMKLVKPRGTIVLKTTVASGALKPIDMSPIVIHEIAVVGSRCGPFPAALDARVKKTVDVKSLITRRASLSEGVDALRNAKGSSVIKILLEP